MRKNSLFVLGVSGLVCLLVGWPVIVVAEGNDSCVLPGRGVISGSVKLDSSCTYFQTIKISQSNTYLNCNGATLEGGGVRAVGIQLDGRKKRLENVTVENCKVQNFRNRGISIASGFRIGEFSSDRQSNYGVAPRNILIDGVTVLGSGRGGVYFDSYVTDSKLINSTVKGSGKVGIYLEQGTQRIQIVNNTIQGNGAEGRREGLAIDSSAHNTVMGNRFVGNAGGGVFIYKNCSENFSSGKSAIRWQSSDFNTIKGNTFTGERVGVWIASRQSKDLSKWDCGDSAVDRDGRFYEDHANSNIVEGNDFCGTPTAIRVEGDNNIIVRNRIDSASRRPVYEPYKDVSKPDGRRTQGNKIEGTIMANCVRE